MFEIPQGIGVKRRSIGRAHLSAIGYIAISQRCRRSDITHLRQLRRNALKEQEANKPPKNFRAIYQLLKELDDQLQKGNPEDADE